MKAARWYGVKDIRVKEVATPEPGPGEVALKVAWTGICGSDLHEYLAGPIFIPVDQDHPLSQGRAPITMGHEYCGTVTELGEGVTNVAVGDRVAVEPIFACGKCPACFEGKYNLCDSLGFVGLSGGHGGFASVSVVPARMVHKIAYRNVYPAVMELMTQGYFSAGNLVTKRISIDNIVFEGFEALFAKKSRVKILVEATD